MHNIKIRNVVFSVMGPCNLNGQQAQKISPGDDLAWMYDLWPGSTASII